MTLAESFLDRRFSTVERSLPNLAVLKQLLLRFLPSYFSNESIEALFTEVLWEANSGFLVFTNYRLIFRPENPDDYLREYPMAAISRWEKRKDKSLAVWGRDTGFFSLRLSAWGHGRALLRRLLETATTPEIPFALVNREVPPGGLPLEDHRADPALWAPCLPEMYGAFARFPAPLAHHMPALAQPTGPFAGGRYPVLQVL